MKPAMRFVWLVHVPWEKGPVQYAEAPKTPFDSVMLATERETGLFVRPCLPRSQYPDLTENS